MRDVDTFFIRDVKILAEKVKSLSDDVRSYILDKVEDGKNKEEVVKLFLTESDTEELVASLLSLEVFLLQYIFCVVALELEQEDGDVIFTDENKDKLIEDTFSHNFAFNVDGILSFLAFSKALNNTQQNRLADIFIGSFINTYPAESSTFQLVRVSRIATLDRDVLTKLNSFLIQHLKVVDSSIKKSIADRVVLKTDNSSKKSPPKGSGGFKN